MKPCLIILISLCIFSSCRYGKPILTAFKEKSVKQDTAKGETTITKRWSFLCIRTGINIGYFELTKTYNSQHILIRKDKYKNTMNGGKRSCCDCPNRSYDKTIFYNSHGKKEKIIYYVVQGGYGSSVLVDKTKILGGKDNLLKRFSSNWKADSLGKNRFRYNAVEDTLTGKIRSIYLTNILHYKKEQVLELLGKPNKIIHNGSKYSLNYFLAQYFAPPVGKNRYSLQIVFENDIAVSVDWTFIDDSNDSIDVDGNGNPIK